ncbi:MAG: hypothetical protein ABIG30_00170 [Candidatus Aenigmatarchaeota archaeon]
MQVASVDMPTLEAPETRSMRQAMKQVRLLSETVQEAEEDGYDWEYQVAFSSLERIHAKSPFISARRAAGEAIEKDYEALRKETAETIEACATGLARNDDRPESDIVLPSAVKTDLRCLARHVTLGEKDEIYGVLGYGFVRRFRNEDPDLFVIASVGALTTAVSAGILIYEAFKDLF